MGRTRGWHRPNTDQGVHDRIWRVEAWRSDPESYYIEATDENIYALFERCSGVLGEGLHESYANRTEFRGDSNTARLELFCILQDEKALKHVQQACDREFDRLWTSTRMKLKKCSRLHKRSIRTSVARRAGEPRVDDHRTEH